MSENCEQCGRYSMIIEWSDEDDAYIVTVPELPGCRTHGSSYEEAVRQGEDAIESWIRAGTDWDQVIPPPNVLSRQGEHEKVGTEAR